jgi:hypothetical protein
MKDAADKLRHVGGCRYFILGAILILFNGFAYANPEINCLAKSSFNKLFKKITQAQPYTFFYHLPISPQGKVKVQSCAYCPIEEANVVAMPIVPLEWLAKDLPCYQHKLCSKPNSLFYKGLSCCQKTDSLYQKMSQDLHNFVLKPA